MLKKRDFFQGFFVISLRFDLEVKGHEGQGQIRVPKKGRWAHDNVKLLHLLLLLDSSLSHLVSDCAHI